MQVRVVFIDDLVNLPEIQVVCPQPLQRFLELLHCDLFASPVSADLGHQEDFVAPALQGAPHPVLAAVVVVLPGVVEESHACVHRLLNYAHCIIEGAKSSKVVSAESDNRDLFAGPPEGFTRNLISASVGHCRRGRRGCRRALHQ